MAANRILVVDDDPVIRFAISNFLRSKCMEVYEAENARRAREQFEAASPDAAILDFTLPDGDGLELLEHFKSADEDLPVIVLTGQGSIELAVRAIKQGAEQFLTKPIELPSLYTLLTRAMDNKRHRQQTLISQSKARREQFDPFVGESKDIRNLRHVAMRLVTTASPILI